MQRYLLLREMASPQLVANSDLIWHVSTLGQFWPGWVLNRAENSPLWPCWVLNRPILAWLGIFFFRNSVKCPIVPRNNQKFTRSQGSFLNSGEGSGSSLNCCVKGFSETDGSNSNSIFFLLQPAMEQYRQVFV